MNFNISVNLNGVIINGFADTEEARKELIKGIKFTIKDLKEEMPYLTSTPVETKVLTEKEEIKEEPKIDYATDGQIKYMNKLGIIIPEGCTKIQAIDLINEWKVAHNIPVGKQK